MACYLIYAWLVVQSDPVKVVESWGRGGGCGREVGLVTVGMM